MLYAGGRGASASVASVVEVRAPALLRWLRCERQRASKPPHLRAVVGKKRSEDGYGKIGEQGREEHQREQDDHKAAQAAVCQQHHAEQQEEAEIDLDRESEDPKRRLLADDPDGTRGLTTRLDACRTSTPSITSIAVHRWT